MISIPERQAATFDFLVGLMPLAGEQNHIVFTGMTNHRQDSGGAIFNDL
jgi:hypothetical protein